MKLYLYLFLSCCFTLSLSAQNFELVNFASGLSSPVDIVSPTETSDYMYVVEKSGRIRVIDETGEILSPMFLNITDRVGDNGGERGLLGLEFSPNYESDGYLFVNYTNNSGNTRVSRFTRSDDNPLTADPDSEVILLTISQPFSNHNGGDLAFGPDGYLYIATGDGGSGGDPQNNSQTRTNLLGKILRIDVLDGTDGYSIPADNPFANDDQTQDEIWALGLRNPWRISFDSETGDLWIADVGQNAREEINFQPADSEGGENYGWRCYEGNQPYNNGSSCPDESELTFPVHTYVNTGGPGGDGCSVTGGFVYRGCDFPDFYGLYIYADYCSGKFWSIEQDGNGNFNNTELLNSTNFNFGAFGEFRSELYVAGTENGIISRLSDPNAQPLQVNGQVTNESCADNNDGSISLNFDGDGLPVTVQWSNGETGPDLTGLNGGTYTATITDAANCTRTRTYVVTTGLPDAPAIQSNVGGDSLFVDDSFTAYQWYLDGTPISGATSNVYIPAESGNYTVEVTNDIGCVLFSNGIDVTLSSVGDLPGLRSVRLFPNPVRDRLTVDLSLADARQLSISLLDVSGKIWSERRLQVAEQQLIDFDARSLPGGIYFVRITDETGVWTGRVVVE